jgi:hypothetical protein
MDAANLEKEVHSMYRFTRAIVSTPGNNFQDGLKGEFGDLGVFDYEKTQKQQRAYVDTLKNCGLEVIELEAEEYPDSTRSSRLSRNPKFSSRRNAIFPGINTLFDESYPFDFAFFFRTASSSIFASGLWM